MPLNLEQFRTSVLLNFKIESLMESYRNERIELLKSLRWGEWYGNPFMDMKTALAELVIIRPEISISSERARRARPPKF